MNAPLTTNPLQLGPPLAQARGSVILIHGRGSSGDNIAGLADELAQAGITYLAPTAPDGVWYPQRFFAPLAQNEPALSNGLRMIDHLVSRANAAGIPFERIGLVGFSQGGCLALEYAARHPRRYGLVAGLSGALIGPLATAREEIDLQGTPVLMGCADNDAHIPLPFVEQSASILANSGASVTKLIFPDGGHTVFPQEIAWLRKQLSAWSGSQ